MFFKTLESFRTGLILFILLAAASAISLALTTHFPAGTTVHDLSVRYGETRALLLVRLGVLNPYSSWWYLPLLMLFTLNLTLCTLRRLPSTLRAMSARPSPPGPDSLSRDKSVILTVQHDSGTAATSTSETLIAERYTVSSKTYGDGVHGIAARKNSWQRLGAPLTHLGLILLIIGGGITAIMGFRTHVDVSEGQEVSVPERDFVVRLERFELAMNEAGEISDYFSTLTVVEGGQPVLTKTIEVNDPLTYDGINFYQSSYGHEGRSFTSASLAVEALEDTAASPRLVRIGLGDTISLGGDDVITATDFSVDFKMDSQGNVFSASSEPRNPAIQIALLRSGTLVARTWLFLMMPEFHGADAFAPLKIHFMGFEPRYRSGIQVTHSPGTSIVFAGFLFASIGVVVALIVKHERIMILVQPKTSSTSEIVWSRSNRADWRRRSRDVPDLLTLIEGRMEGKECQKV
jgi:cytochrome c biogenesis protein